MENIEKAKKKIEEKIRSMNPTTQFYLHYLGQK